MKVIEQGWISYDEADMAKKKQALLDSFGDGGQCLNVRLFALNNTLSGVVEHGVIQFFTHLCRPHKL